MIQLSPSRGANHLAVLVLCAAVGLLWLAWQVAQGVQRTVGPTALGATADGTLYLATGEEVWRIDAQGVLRARVPLGDALGPRSVSDLAVSDGALWVAEGTGRRIWRCDPGPVSCEPWAAVPPDGARTGKGGSWLGDASAPLKLTLAPGRLYVADTEGHAVHAYDADGRHLYRLAVPGGLRYPNGLTWLGDGQVLVADTNQHRVVIVRDQGGGRATIVQQKMIDDAHARAGRRWPLRAWRDDSSRLWVLQADGLLRHADLVRVEPHGGGQTRVPLVDSADPVALAAAPAGLLLADLAGYRVWQVAADGASQLYGDATLLDALEALQARRAQWVRTHRAGIGLALALAMLAGVALVLDRQARRGKREARERAHCAGMGMGDARWQGAVTDPQWQPDHRGIVWLYPSERMQREARRMSWIMGICGLTGVIAPAVVFPDLSDALRISLAAVMLSTVACYAWILRGVVRLRLGTDGRMLHAVDVFGRHTQAMPSECALLPTKLVLGATSVPLHIGHSPTFDTAAFDRLLGPLLADVPRRGELGHTWLQMRRGHPATWAAVAAIVGAVALVVWFRL